MGNTALHIAAGNGRADQVRLLISLGARVDQEIENAGGICLLVQGKQT
jgi:ankyrin repeat protein